MAEKSRLMICRITFLLLALFPLVASVSWATYRHVALDGAAYRSWIAAQTGLDLKLRRVIHSQPNLTRFEGLNIVDPENGELIARCDAASVRRGDSAIGLHFSTITVQPSQFRRLLELLHDRVLRQQRLISRPVFVVAESVVLPGNGHEWKLRELRLDVEKARHGPEAMLTFRWAERPEGELVRLHLLRDHSEQPASTKIELLTGDTPLPCSLFVRWPDPWQQLGENMTFQGNLHMRSADAGWRGEVTGHLANVQLEHFAATEEAPVVTGTLHVTLRQAAFQGSWMQSLSGRLEAGPGLVQNDALRSVAEHLELIRPSTQQPQEEQFIGYEQLAIEFRLNRDSAQIFGACQGAHAGIIMQGQQGPILLESANTSARPVSLVRALLGLSPSDMPISPQRQPLLRVLPVGL